MIVVVGAGLAGIAAAARLAKVGHRVCLIERTEQLPIPDVATEPGGQVITLPAAWRDVFTKSGRPLAAELARRGLELVPAPPRRYRIDEAAGLDLPCGRAEQWFAIRSRFGEPAATAWQDLLDRAEEWWLELRGVMMEAEFTGLPARARKALAVRQSVADLAATMPVPELAEVVLQVAAGQGQDPTRYPGWQVFRLSLERGFGRWRLHDRTGQPQPATSLAQLLVERALSKGVELRSGVEVDRIRWNTDGFEVRTSAERIRADAVISTVRPSAHAQLTDHRLDYRVARRLRPAPGPGPRWESWRTLLDLPRIEPIPNGPVIASGWSPAGPDSWAQLLTGALASYRIHWRLTGEDIRGTNKSRQPRTPSLRSNPERGGPA